MTAHRVGPEAGQTPLTRFEWRHQYDDRADAIARAATDIDNTAPSLTQQSFADDANLQKVLEKWGVTDGALPPYAPDLNYFGDFSDVPEYRDALENTRVANERFNALPAEIRSYFNNNPLTLYKWVNDPENWDEAVELGLLHKTAVETPPEPKTGAAAAPPTPPETPKQ
jgi:hypothetical protein